MPEYLSPGVYVEEVDRGPKPIEGVGTATAAFIGFTEKAQRTEQIDGEIVTHNLLNKPQLITNWSQFIENFGEFVEGAYLPHAVYGYFMNGGGRCYVMSVRTIPKAQAALLNEEGKPLLIAQAKQSGFDGLRLRVKIDTPLLEANAGAAGVNPALKKKKDTPEGPEGSREEGSEETPNGSSHSFTLTVQRETPTGGWQTKEVLRNVTLVETQQEGGQKTVRVMYQNNKASQLIDLVAPKVQAPLAKFYPRSQQQSLQIERKELEAPTASEFQGQVEERTGVSGLESLDDVTMVCVPDLMTTPPGEKLNLDTVKSIQTAMIAHCERMGDRVALIDPPPNLRPQQINQWRMDVAGYDSSYAALYYPWIQVYDPFQNRPVHIPPSGHIAGIWARNDNTQGVHKAPANEVVLGVTGLAYNTTKGEQDVLNPNGVNCIRAFPGRGIRVWGARTLSSNPAWRYINVRRLFNFVEKSIERGTQWVVFEPNNRTLWARVRRDITAFLRTIWSDGALFGNNPGEAFYVKCDDELNPPESRDLGRLVVEVGMCPVKPAEFVIFRVSQWAGPNAES